MRKAAAEIAKSVADLSDLISKLDKEVADHIGPDCGSLREQAESRQPSRRSRRHRSPS